MSTHINWGYANKEGTIIKHYKESACFAGIGHFKGASSVFYKYNENGLSRINQVSKEIGISPEDLYHFWLETCLNFGVQFRDKENTPDLSICIENCVKNGFYIDMEEKTIPYVQVQLSLLRELEEGLGMIANLYWLVQKLDRDLTIDELWEAFIVSHVDINITPWNISMDEYPRKGGGGHDIVPRNCKPCNRVKYLTLLNQSSERDWEVWRKCEVEWKLPDFLIGYDPQRCYPPPKRNTKAVLEAYFKLKGIKS